MKLLVGALVLWMVAGNAEAQTANAVLAKVQTFYAGTQQLSATFEQTVTNATFNSTQKSEGRLWVAKPSQFRFDYTSKRTKKTEKNFIFDGTTLWFVDHPNLKIYKQSTAGSTLPAAVAFLTGGGSLANDFTIALNTSGAYGGTGATVLELTPKSASAQYKQLFFVVDPADSHITQSIVVTPSGDVQTFTFKAPDYKTPIKPTTFQFTPRALPAYQVTTGSTGASSAPTKPAPASRP
jgi:outer membrane lipoprotein carrier protein